MEYRNLNYKSVHLSKEQLEQYLEKLASDHMLKKGSESETYPIPKLKENFLLIEQVYQLLNEHIKLEIPIHPAGEWLLDNFYIIEEVYKTIIKEMTLKRYKEFLSIDNGKEKGFARIYVLASEIVNYTDNHIEISNIKDFLCAYQRKKTLSMNEIWAVRNFMQIALIQNIRDICEKIYYSQMQKYRVENILERLIEKEKVQKYKNLSEYKMRVTGYGEVKYPFIEYLSYRLTKLGRKALPYINVLEEQVNKTGTSLEEVIKKEHFDIALKRVSMANCITSMKELQHMDFSSIFENSNGVEKILRQDPLNIYSKMTLNTKEKYRDAIIKISKETKIAEVYIAKKAVKLANEVFEENKIKGKELDKRAHVGYYLIGDGIGKLYEEFEQKAKRKMKEKTKVNIYIFSIWFISLIVDAFCIYYISKIHNIVLTTMLGILLILPIEETVLQIIQYILGKIVKPKLIPKIDFSDGIPKDYSTFIVIPTILKNKEKVAELMKKLEIYYLSNKSENLYFALLGDCSSGQNKEEKYDKEIIEEGLKQVERLNKKYKTEGIPKFHFIYRKRNWNGQEECYLGWERKRGLLNQFNEYLLGNEENKFKVNTIKNIPKIKYIITLDSDTELGLNSAFELIGAMAHIINKPILNDKKDCVIGGHALIQPRIGITMEDTNKNLFTKIFAGNGGIDAYTNAVSDIYQDNFDEGIFTGKGIYDLEIFSKVLKNQIPENMVLSHDLLEGNYLRCGLATDIVLMDGYPTTYMSFKQRMNRWLRGDIQITRWTKNTIIDKKNNKNKNPLNTLSRYKIIDNILKGITPIFSLIALVLIYIINMFYRIKSIPVLLIILMPIICPVLLDTANRIIGKRKGKSYFKTFYPKMNSLTSSIIRSVLCIALLPDRAVNNINAISKSVYRINISKKHLLEWTTSEETEILTKTELRTYLINMLPNIIFGLFSIAYSIMAKDIFLLILSILWISAPVILWNISKKEKQREKIEELNKEERKYVNDIARKTWQYFKDVLVEDNNYMPTDNYQEDRKTKFVDRTSCTNIGLALLAVISSYDLGYENLEDTLKLLYKMLETINKLPKWNGHLYNWYNIKTLEPLQPRYISTVDSGNFVGYIYTLKAFYEKIQNEIKDENLLKLIPKWVEDPIEKIEIANADFSKLYDYEKNLFSIGYNIEENKLTPSYYDLLASEARQTSFIAISKRDVPIKHFNHLSRTLTELNGYNGLVSWSGTAFEYLMPNIIMKNVQGSLIDESCEFMLMSQKEYARKLKVPWGFSETAYYLKDLNNNFQYKAIGLPWLGLKRGLEEDIVVSSYASIIAITRHPKEVVRNLKLLDKQGIFQKYGFYESIDYTPIRMPKGKKQMPVKTYMAHHQGLILISIDNLFNNNIMQKRFSSNPEIASCEILLQEIMPERRIVTKQDKIKPEKIVYKDYENYAKRIYKKMDSNLPICNVLSNDNYSIIMDFKGNGYSKYKNYLINKYSFNGDSSIKFYIKNINSKKIWSINSNYGISDKYEIIYTEDSNEIKRNDSGIESNLKITISPEKAIEIRKLKLINHNIEEQTLEVTTEFEPVILSMDECISHPAFQNLFLMYEYLEDENIFIIKRKNRNDTKKDLYLAVTLFTEESTMGDLEYEIDKEKFKGRGNYGIPDMIEKSKPFSKKIQFVTDPILALRRTTILKPEKELEINLIISISENKQEVIENIREYKSAEKINKTFDLNIAKADTESRYLGLKANQIITYQKMLGYILFSNLLQNKDKFTKEYYEKDDLWKYGISGDLPILLIKIRNSNEIEILEEILKAYKFFKLKNIDIDLVIENLEQNSYEKYLKSDIQNIILNANMGYMQNIRNGIFVIEEENETIEFYAKLVIDAKKGAISRQLEDLEEEYKENIIPISEKIFYQNELVKEEQEYIQKSNKPELLYENEYGGFSQDGKEYMIIQNKENKLPTVWSNIMANKEFGTLVTDSMGGFVYSKNSGLNKITNWSNNQIDDFPSEVIYMQDDETLKTWSLGLNPMPDNNEYKTIYGFGYSIYEHISNNIRQELTTFIPENDNVKVYILNLKNLTNKKKKLNIVYYIEPVLGENYLKTNGYINLDFLENNNMIILQNKINSDFKEKIYVSASEKIRSYTGDKEFFIGSGNIANPDALKKIYLNNINSLGKEQILAIKMQVELEEYQNKELVILLGSEQTLLDSQDKVYQYSKIEKAQLELNNVKEKWKNVLGKIQVSTPLKSFDIMMNGWLTYQNIVSRLYARSGFYQSGGAYGFRDQLQDTIGLKYLDINIMKEQIIKHAKHQFIEGDVEHWWHEETKRGIRTRFSDDLLWLVYIVEEYINFTGDYSILEIEVPYVEGKELENGIDEKYDIYNESNIKETIYMHCKRAIDKSLDFGENDLPKIGSGDWNDGLSKVGNKGKGESVWLGFFLYDIIQKWIKINEEIEKTIKVDGDIEKFKVISEKLKKALNKSAWDGRWYRRAFTDDNQILGSLQNEECKIDSISQSWAVMSNAGDNDKKYISMESLENHLVDRENGIIKLLDPPFEKSDLEPGYIKAYLPGTRENGGQYTHAAIWAIIAETLLGFGDKALELFKMINPIEHSKTKEASSKYKVEPYVVAADIYGQGNLAGRGGWTWYTGSASWMYEAGLHYILGFTIEKGYLSINPSIPSEWKEYKIHYKYKDSIYNIFVKNPNSKNIGVTQMKFNGSVIEEKKIKLIDNGKVNEIEIVI